MELVSLDERQSNSLGEVFITATLEQGAEILRRFQNLEIGEEPFSYTQPAYKVTASTCVVEEEVRVLAGGLSEFNRNYSLDLDPIECPDSADLINSPFPEFKCLFYGGAESRWIFETCVEANFIEEVHKNIHYSNSNAQRDILFVSCRPFEDMIDILVRDDSRGLDFEFDSGRPHLPLHKCEELHLQAREKFFEIVRDVLTRDPDRYKVIKSLEKYGMHAEKLEEIIREIEVAELLEGGFSKKTVGVNNLVFQVGPTTDLRRESYVYSLHMPRFLAYMPRWVDFLDAGKHSVLVYERVGKTNKLSTEYFKTVDSTQLIVDNLYLMALFHTEATRASARVPVESSEGKQGSLKNYVGQMSEPLRNANYTRDIYKKFFSSIDPSLQEFIIHVASRAQAYIREDATTFIHGDWKLENLLVADHDSSYDISQLKVIDYTLSGAGAELEDVTYFLSDSTFELPPEGIKYFVKQYIEIRARLDPEFRSNSDRIRNMKRDDVLNTFLVPQLARRHAVQRKRDLTSPLIAKNRDYYLSTLLEVVSKGVFI